MPTISTTKVEIQGFDRLLDQLEGAGKLIGQPWTHALGRGVARVLAIAQRQAPVGNRGQLRASIQSKLGRNSAKYGVPMSGTVYTDEADSKGRRYPWMLEASKKIVYHYRGGAFAGNPTAGWFRGSLDEARPAIEGDLQGAVREIESAWSRI
jgi:hypothetical protein